MKRAIFLKPVFVDHIPEELVDGHLYISIQFGSILHRCCCGCGIEVVTPLSPTQWRMIYDGQTVSLEPSIGNWNFPCRSHYWVRRNLIEWASAWSQAEVDSAQRSERDELKEYFESRDATGAASIEISSTPASSSAGWVGRLTEWVKRIFGNS